MAPRRRNTKNQNKVISTITTENLVFENALCPVCRSILIEPVTLPCGHHFCYMCFNGTVNNAALVCPLCRTRISSWLRTARKENKLINENLWSIIQDKFSTFVANKRQGNEDYLDDSITTTPRIIATPGQIKDEFTSQLEIEQQTLRKERAKEEAASETYIRQLQEQEELAASLEAEKIQRDAEIARKLAEEEAQTAQAQATKSNKKKGPLDTFVTLGDIQKYGCISHYTLSFVKNKTDTSKHKENNHVKRSPGSHPAARVNLFNKRFGSPEKNPFPPGLPISDRRQYLLDNCVAHMKDLFDHETDDIITKEITHIKPIKIVPLTPQKVLGSTVGVKSPIIRSAPVRLQPNPENSLHRIKSPIQQIISPNAPRASAFICATPNKYDHKYLYESIKDVPKTNAVKKIKFDANENEAETSNIDLIIYPHLNSPLGSPFTGFEASPVNHFTKFKAALQGRFDKLFTNDPVISANMFSIDMHNVPSTISKSEQVELNPIDNCNIRPTHTLNTQDIILEQQRLEESILQERRDLEYARKLHEELNQLAPKTYELRTPNNRYVVTGRIEKRSGGLLRSNARKRQSTIEEMCSRKKYKV